MAQVTYKKVKYSKGERYQKKIEGSGTVFCSRAEFEANQSKAMPKEEPQPAVPVEPKEEKVETPPAEPVKPKEEEKEEKPKDDNDNDGNIWGM